MSARIGLDNPGFEGRLRYQNRGSSYIRRSVVDGLPQAQVFDIIPENARRRSASAPRPNMPPKASLSSSTSNAVSLTPSLFAAQLHANRPVAPTQKALKKKIIWPARQVLAIYSMAGLLFVVGSFVAINGLFANRHVEAQVRTITKASNASAAVDAGTTDSSVPSSQEPSAATIRKYTVAPNMARYIDIPKLGKHARVISVGTRASGALGTPGNVYDIGWYNGSNLPGQPGAMLVDGHVSSWTAHGTFYKLKTLVAGDKIKIQRGDGKIFSYKVVKSKLYDHNHVDMKSAVRSVDPKKPGLNMITCAGKVIPGTSEFDQRLIVYAVQE